MIFLLLGAILVGAGAAMFIALQGLNKKTETVSLKPLETGPRATPDPVKIPEPALQAAPGSMVRMYSPALIALATFLGTPLAGCILIARNYRALAKFSMVRQTVIIGIVLSVLVIALGYFIPYKSFTAILPFIYTMGMYNGVKRLPDANYASHIANGGAKASPWMAVGIGLACMCVIAVILAIILMVTGGLK